MNRRQAKKRRKKALYDLPNRPDAIQECYEKLINMAERIGQVLNKWLESGMPFPKEGEKNESSD